MRGGTTKQPAAYPRIQDEATCRIPTNPRRSNLPHTHESKTKQPAAYLRIQDEATCRTRSNHQNSYQIKHKIFMKTTWLFLLILFITPALIAQTIPNPSTVDVGNLSDAQIQRIISEMQTRGLTQDQAITMAKAQGASQTQIDQLTMRIQQLQTGGTKPGAALAGVYKNTKRSIVFVFLI